MRVLVAPAVKRLAMEHDVSQVYFCYKKEIKKENF